MSIGRYGIIALMSILAACNDEEQKATAPVAEEIKPVVACYMSVSNHDTVRLQTTTTGLKVTGTLSYSYFEKDKNTGTINGEMKGELLVVDYRFKSEGSESVRQVIFKKQEENFVEGYGPGKEVNGKMQFEKPDSLNFEKSVPLLPVNCR